MEKKHLIQLWKQLSVETATGILDLEMGKNSYCAMAFPYNLGVSCIYDYLIPDQIKATLGIPYFSIKLVIMDKQIPVILLSLDLMHQEIHQIVGSPFNKGYRSTPSTTKGYCMVFLPQEYLEPFRHKDFSWVQPFTNHGGFVVFHNSVNYNIYADTLHTAMIGLGAVKAYKVSNNESGNVEYLGYHRVEGIGGRHTHVDEPDWGKVLGGINGYTYTGTGKRQHLEFRKSVCD